MNAQVISFKCILKNKAGRLISTTFNRDVLNISLSDSGHLPELAKSMQNLKTGECRSISLSAEQAYGLYDPKKVILFPKKKLPENATIGMSILIRGKSGAVRSYKVLGILEDFAKLDGNHELAGQDLVFEIETLSARPATQAELEESTVTADEPQLLH